MSIQPKLAKNIFFYILDKQQVFKFLFIIKKRFRHTQKKNNVLN